MENIYEFSVRGNKYTLELGKCAVALFRQKQEVSYVAMNHSGDDKDTVRYFNENFARWVAGYAIMFDPDDGEIDRITVFDEEDGKTFRQRTGWTPTIIEKEEPFDWEIEAYIRVQMQELDYERDD